MNISGIVVRTAPECFESVLEELRSSGLCEVHFYDRSGKIIVTLEGEDTSEEVQKMKEIMNIPNVLSASLAYSCNDKELNEAFRLSEKEGRTVPDSLREL
jgi:nitrate reductase NapD